MTEKDWKRLLFRVRCDILDDEVPLSADDIREACQHPKSLTLLRKLVGAEDMQAWVSYIDEALKEGEELDAMMAPLLKLTSVFTGILFCKNCDHQGDEPDFITDDHEIVCPQCLSIKIGRRRDP